MRKKQNEKNQKTKKIIIIVATLTIITVVTLTIFAVIESGTKVKDYILEPLGVTVSNFESVVGKKEVILEEKEVLEDAEGMDELIKYTYKYKTKKGNKDAENYANYIKRRGFLPATDYDYITETGDTFFVKEIDKKHYTAIFMKHSKEEVEIVLWIQEGTVELDDTVLSEIDSKVLKDLLKQMEDTDKG